MGRSAGAREQLRLSHLLHAVGRLDRQQYVGIELGEQRYVELSEAEQFVLTLSERGYGKRTSSYEYRITGRGGKGTGRAGEWAEAGYDDRGHGPKP